MNNIDWSYLRIPLIVWLLSLSLSFLAYWLVENHYSKIYSSYLSQEQAHIAIKRKFDEARRNRALYQQYLAQYKQLQENGIIGEEQRLSWIEELQNINKKYRFVGLHYEISPQRTVNLPKVNLSDNVKINVSSMKIQAGLLHEGDVVSFWQELRSNAKGLFGLEECSIESKFRRGQAITYSPYSRYVQLNCHVNWYSIMAKTS
jgi:hypothetical protein